ncbi:hypothetical protein SGUI_1712 [Serinicoccus hydrothermalis]|uniref:Histone acetyltransferase Rv0428c-like SH3 domain-containing protein n=1 Tax=Serinicoccus hydrothermalis TaxID=1758689 RepID=A0A1B1NCF2_9MICO|nr:HAD family hydrolase [Serinicoccus hydrothermalis]ANS79108.1 hypothetical protein SGUI_1712 [Serinicoccus hydrothermalis]
MADRDDRAGRPTDRLTLGSRVVVRHLIEGGERATDTLGVLVRLDPQTLVVRSDRGQVSIAADAVVAAKPVPERPWRLASFLRRARVAVLDLDGVLRDFDATGERARSERELGLPEAGLPDLAYALPQARAMVVGEGTYAEWVSALREHLLGLGHPEPLVAQVVQRWEQDRGTPVAATVELLDEVVADGIPVFVLTNGSDRVPEELERIGLGRLVPRLLNSHGLGVAKPDPAAYAAAHAEIARRLGREVPPDEVRFTDDRPDNVDAARAFGWQAQVFRPRPQAG